MERNRRLSRLPTPRFFFNRRRPQITISEPIDRVEHNQFATSSDEEGYITQDMSVTDEDLSSKLGSGNTSTINCHEQASRMNRPVPRLVTQFEKASPTWPLLKSSTLHVFTGTPPSLSRSSLCSSSCVDTSSSTASLFESANRSFPLASKLSHPCSIPIQTNGRWSAHSTRTQRHLLPRDPHLVYDAQPSAYWTGRFMALRDRLQTESLSPNHAQSRLRVRKERPATANQQECECRHLQTDNKIRRHDVRFNTRLPSPITGTATVQQLPNEHGHGLANAALALDDDEKCLGVFVHLEALCVTDEARKSLRLWQQDFARKMGRKKLLPEGGSLEERFGGSYFTKIIGGRRRRHRASVM